MGRRWTSSDEDGRAFWVKRAEKARGHALISPEGSPPDVLTEGELMLLRSENLELRSLVARLHAENLEMKVAATTRDGSDRLDTGIPARRLRDELQQGAEALERAAAALRQANEQAETVERQADLLRRKDMLIRETDHRVRNSLAMIISLLHMEAGHHKDPAVLDPLRLACARVEAVAKVHDMLHAQGSTDALDFGAYIRALCASLAAALGADGRGRKIVMEVEPVTMAPVTAQALALAVSELVTNAFRHGFAPEAPGTVWVQGRRGADGGFRLTVADDGKGLPNGFELGHGAGLGHRLVAMMAEQIGADLEVAGKSGARVTLAVPASCIG